MAQRVERLTRDRNVTGSTRGRNGVNRLCRLLFGVRFIPRVTAVARKRR